VPFFVGDSHEGIIDFVAWSTDSNRLLVALRGGDFDDQRNRGVYRWFVYFNTKNQNFELTDYLRRLNRGAWDRYANFSEDNPDVGLVEEVIAEPLSELPPEAESKKRYEKADRHLNELYQKVSKQGSQEAQTNWSRDRKQWIRNREAGAKLYAQSGPERTAGRRYWLLMAESTEAHASQIESALKEAPSHE
jgi:lysozyme inhibitor LprI